ncbi:T9SS type B sorting domain-containing protein [Aestuariivivens insulae]|uniref:T9SS type B sorting domain-containing protein n=1 Tax=Aestuariivivens insulae TaxID=1621988 RepID=UPI001F572F59|nr:T9SS type B sorting domain-containing protein [Aestuariivivens insulae]
MNFKKKIITFIASCFIVSFIYGQGGSANKCINARPLCGDGRFSYPNTSGGPFFAESDPDYGCVGYPFNPSWFYFKVAKDGNIGLTVQQSSAYAGIPNLDADFVAYGPFADASSPCTSDLTASNIVDCGSSPSVVEYINIPNAKEGDYYLLMITNFTTKPGFIRVIQTDGAGFTDCSILSDNIACEGDFITMDATTPNATSYIWYEEVAWGTGNFVVIAGEHNKTFNAVASNHYKAEAYDVFGNLLNTYNFEALFFQTPSVPSSIKDYPLCDASGDGSMEALFDLSTMDSEVLGGLDPAVFSVSYYDDHDKANLGEEALPELYKSSEKTIYARIDNIATSSISCFDTGSFKIVVEPLPEISLQDQYILCVDTNGTEEILAPPIIDTGFDAVNYSFIWSLDGVVLLDETDSILIPNEEGSYSVEVTNLLTGCSNSTSTTVNLSSPPDISASVTSYAFTQSNTIEATAIGKGFEDYEFSIDSGVWQANGAFNNVSYGEHIIKARDINGCGVSETKVFVIDYPFYFTPNGDNNHDTWNIVGVEHLLNAKVYIFDRYGKLMKQLSPGTSQGWDGRFNGTLMPSDDYWFVIEYEEPLDKSIKQYRSHFALRR